MTRPWFRPAPPESIGTPVRLGAETWSGQPEPELSAVPTQPQQLASALIPLALFGAGVGLGCLLLALFPPR